MKGLKYCPLSKSNYAEHKKDLTELGSRLSKHEIFFGKPNKDLSLVRNKAKRHIQTESKELNDIINTLTTLEPEYNFSKDNISQQERVALYDLMTNTNIIFKKADKGGSIVIMDKIYYRDKLVIENHLNNNTYKIIHKHSDNNVVRNLKQLVERYKSNLTTHEVDFLTHFTWKSSQLYIPPKLHKCKSLKEYIEHNPGNYIEFRNPSDLTSGPIIAGPESPTQRLSKLIEKLLKPLIHRSQQM